MSDVAFLVVDPDSSVDQALRRALKKPGVRIFSASRGEDGLRRAAAIGADAILLRTSLPDMSGCEFIARFRQETEAVRSPNPTPMLLMARRGEEAEVTAGLERGAIGVMFLPLREPEVAQRLNGLLQWARRRPEQGVVRAGPVSVDFERGEILKPQATALTSLELEILRRLLSPPGRAVTRRQIPAETERSVDVHVASLRSKLGPEGTCIETLRGIGYRFRGVGDSQ